MAGSIFNSITDRLSPEHRENYKLISRKECNIKMEKYMNRHSKHVDMEMAKKKPFLDKGNSKDYI